MKKEIEQLRKEFNERIDALLKEEPKELELNRWYKYKNTNQIIFRTSNYDNYGIAYGEWRTDLYCSGKWFIPATDKEVRDALIAEAKKRGFYDIGNKFISSISDNCKKREIRPYNTQGEISYIFDDNGLWCDEGMATFNKFCSNPYIFKDGKWAEIIQEETIKIGEYPIEFKYGNAFINGLAYSKNDFEKVKEVLCMHNVHSLNVGCNGQYEVDLDTINKILCKLK
jgi:hypothetical protein